MFCLKVVRTLLAFFFLVVCSLTELPAQEINGNHAFRTGEVMEYDAYYNLGPLWIKLGYAKFTVDSIEGNYKFTVTAYNLPKWDWVYSLHTVHTSICTPDLTPLFYSAITTENGVHTELTYDYDTENNMVHRWSKGSSAPNGSSRVFSVIPHSQDILNSIYVARNVDLTQNNGVDIPFYPIYDDTVVTVLGSVIGREMIKTREGVEYYCKKCTAIPPANTLFDASEPVFVWITDDKRVVPVLVEAKIMIGRVKIYLSSYKE